VGEEWHTPAMTLLEAECDVIVVDTAHAFQGLLDTVAASSANRITRK